MTQDPVGREPTVLYGGSVNPGNARGLAARPHIDGLFIGRSAWTPEGYLGLVEDVTRGLAGG